MGLARAGKRGGLEATLATKGITMGGLSVSGIVSVDAMLHLCSPAAADRALFHERLERSR